MNHRRRGDASRRASSDGDAPDPVSERGPTVAEVGESALIQRIAARIGSSPDDEVWTGDDAAVVLPASRELIYTTDLLVEAIDFDLSYCSGEDVGWKGMAVNVSDIAAMGARPTHGVVNLSLRSETPLALFDAILDGLLLAAQRWGIALVGGDISGAEELTLSVALLGAPFEGGPVLRSGARRGHAVCVTGSLGGAAGGLLLLARGAPRSDAAARVLAERQLRPQARVDESERLCALPATAMIDLSDGLAVDLGRLMDSSGTGCRIEPSAVPVDPHLEALEELLPGEEARPYELALTGGEDFELLFTIEEGHIEAARSALAGLGTSVAHLGTVTAGGCFVGDDPLETWRRKGWEHLRSR